LWQSVNNLPSLHNLYLTFYDSRACIFTMRVFAQEAAPLPCLAEFGLTMSPVNLHDLQQTICKHATTLRKIDLQWLDFDNVSLDTLRSFWNNFRDELSLE